jgi:hypothetical protein
MDSSFAKTKVFLIVYHKGKTILFLGISLIGFILKNMLACQAASGDNRPNIEATRKYESA